jgi:hypothetical protein
MVFCRRALTYGMRALPLFAVVFLGACASDGTLAPSQLAKTEVDRVVDVHRHEIFVSLKLLADKLYRRNPREWKKGGQTSQDAAIAQLFDPQLAWRLPSLEGKRGVDALAAGLRDDYRGDRVAAFIGGLGGMLHAAYNEKSDFFLLDDVDPQKLYNSARNIEIAVWKLTNSRDVEGKPLLLTNDMQAIPNLSFEREFGKMIGNLDLLARIVSDKTNRTVVKVIQNMATAVFLPVPGLR